MGNVCQYPDTKILDTDISADVNYPQLTENHYSCTDDSDIIVHIINRRKKAQDGKSNMRYINDNSLTMSKSDNFNIGILNNFNQSINKELSSQYASLDGK